VDGVQVSVKDLDGLDSALSQDVPMVWTDEGWRIEADTIAFDAPEVTAEAVEGVNITPSSMVVTIGPEEITIVKPAPAPEGYDGYMVSGDAAFSSEDGTGVIEDGYMDFANQTQFIDLGTDSNFDLGNAFTVSAWVKLDQLKPYAGIAGKMSVNRGTSRYRLACHNDGKICAYNGSQWLFSGDAGITTGQWYYLTWVLESGKMHYYVDGESYGSVPFSYSDSTSYHMMLGSWSSNSSYKFNGKMDDVAIYDRALSQEEIQSDMDTELTGTETGLAAYYPFDDGVVEDKSVNENYVWSVYASPGTRRYYDQDESCALEAGEISDGETSVIEREVTIGLTGEASFWWKASSEQDKDFFRFYVDGELIDQISGQTGWAKVTRQLSSGTHMLRWEYAKDDSGSAGEDTAWLDRVEVRNTGPKLTDFNDGTLGGFETAGNSNWYNDNGAAHSGATSGGWYSYLKKTVYFPEPTTVRFDWKASTGGRDLLWFNVDSVGTSSENVYKLVGSVDWHEMTYAIPAGTHTLYWVYYTGNWGTSAANCAWVDNIWMPVPEREVYDEFDVFTPLTYSAIDIYFDGESIDYDELYEELTRVSNTPGLGVEVVSDDIIGGTMINGTIRFTTADLALVTDVSGSLTGVDTAAGTMTIAGIEALAPSVIRINGLEVTLAELEDIFLLSEEDAAMSGIRTLGTCRGEYTTAGRILFLEDAVDLNLLRLEGDNFRFYVNDELVSEIQAEVDWTEVTQELTAGTYTLRWEYAKDDLWSAGEDAAWLDDLVVESGAQVTEHEFTPSEHSECRDFTLDGALARLEDLAGVDCSLTGELPMVWTPEGWQVEQSFADFYVPVAGEVVGSVYTTQDSTVATIGAEGITVDDPALPEGYSGYQMTGDADFLSQEDRGVTFVGQSDSFMSFDGTDDYISTSLNIKQTDNSSPGVTFEAWVYPTTTTTGRDIIIGSDNGGYDWSLTRNGGTWRVYTGDKEWNTEFSVSANEWQHVAAVFDPASNTIHFYKNGQQATYSGSISYDSSDGNVYIGRRSSTASYYFEGYIDEAAVWNRPLSAGEVRTRAYDKLTEMDAGLIAYYSFDNGTAVDDSASSYNGTISGAASVDGRNWTQVKHDENGEYAVRPGDISDGETSVIEKEITLDVEGELNFWWKVSSEENKDFFRFYIDESLVDGISGDVDWQIMTETLSSGDHTLKWEYSKDASGSAGLDTAWLDEVKVTAAATTVAHDGFDVFDSLRRNSVDIYFDDELIEYGELCGRLIQARGLLGMGVEVVSDDLLGGVITDGVIRFYSGGLASLTDISGIITGVDTAAGTLTIGALDILAPSVMVLNGREVTLTELNEIFLLSEADAGMSGIRTLATCKGEYTTAGRVLVQGDSMVLNLVRLEGDTFKFYVDDELVREIQGEIDWAEVTHELSAGTYTLRWEYSKDDLWLEGRDTAWLDDLVVESGQQVTEHDFNPSEYSECREFTVGGEPVRMEDLDGVDCSVIGEMAITLEPDGWRIDEDVIALRPPEVIGPIEGIYTTQDSTRLTLGGRDITVTDSAALSEPWKQDICFDAELIELIGRRHWIELEGIEYELTDTGGGSFRLRDKFGNSVNVRCVVCGQRKLRRRFRAYERHHAV